ncbi:MAG: undecaprenyl-diphosphate phosphatase [Oscillospiraceae bacterium]|nr:undecaprenyl-diphosphate phosphatase [Oscillospiraceae bacterium]
MDLNWLQSLLYGLLSGLMDILPVSAQAHRVLLLKFFGADGKSDLLYLMIHLGNFAALYFSCTNHLVRMSRASRLSRIPKRKRKRPLDVKSLMDVRMLRTMLIPALLGIYLRQYTLNIQKNLLIISLFLFLNGVILYAPQFFATGNRDSRTLSRVEGLLMGLGGGISILPGISATGSVTSIGSVCGVDKTYCLDMALLLNLFMNLGYAFVHTLGIAAGGAGAISFGILMRYLFTAVASFGGTMLGIRSLRALSETHGYYLFGLYCFGLSVFSFILNLLA